MKIFKSIKIKQKTKVIPNTKNISSKNKPIRILRQSPRQTRIELLHPVRHDLYHWLLVISWSKFLFLVSLFYLIINCLFALVYLFTGDGIANAEVGSFHDAFFFSIQTLSTVGYGSMYPQTIPTQILVTIEVLVGLLSVAILTGLMFARFSRPTARIIFSDVAVICPFNGIPTLMFRAANGRENRILEAQIKVNLVRNEISSEGLQLRRFYDLQLLRSQTPIFGLSWLVMHPIEENSPLFPTNLQQLAAVQGEIWITLTGLDETFSQTIHARHSYRVSDILQNSRFVDIFGQTSEGQYYIDYSLFHEVLPLE